MHHKAKQSPTIPGAVARYVGSPVGDINVLVLTTYTPGTTDQPTPGPVKTKEPRPSLEMTPQLCDAAWPLQ